jgi:nucleotidyltransferase substrate binding protein (TIGR01987 family)
VTELGALFEKSLQRLKDIVQAQRTVANRDSTVKRFEFTTELAWKVIQKFLRDQGILCRSPRECIREAFKFGLISDDERWLQMLEDRNLTVHTYNETTADEVYSRVPTYIGLFETLLLKLSQM